MRLTHAFVQVTLALSEDPFGRHWGYDLTRRARVRSGVLYPILERMLAEEWLTDGWEDPKEAIRRPQRRYYELTDKGRNAIGAVLSQASADVRFAPLFGMAT